MQLSPSALGSLRFFQVAARLSSFKLAAADLHVTPGAVSQQIKQLEHTLGCKLFYRLTRGIRLTEEGERFARIVQSSLAEIDQAASRAAAAAHSIVDIRVRVGPSFALRWLVPRLGEFYMRHPELRLHILGDYGHLDPVRHEFDLAIELIRGTIPGLRIEVLMAEYLIPVCSPDYLRAHSFLKVPADLARCTLLHDGQAWVGAGEDAEWRHWLDQVGADAVDSSQGRFFSLSNLSLEAALNHQGVAMGRASLIREWVAGGQLVSPIDRKIRSPTAYCLLYAREIEGRGPLQAVIAWLREEAARSVAEEPAPQGGGSPL